MPHSLLRRCTSLEPRRPSSATCCSASRTDTGAADAGRNCWPAPAHTSSYARTGTRVAPCAALHRRVFTHARRAAARRLAVTLPEVASAVSCDAFAVGRSALRVAEHLGVQLPAADTSALVRSP